MTEPSLFVSLLDLKETSEWGGKMENFPVPQPQNTLWMYQPQHEVDCETRDI